MFRCFVVVCWLVAATAAYAEPRTLSGPAIKHLVSGTVMHINTPLNTIIPVRYGEDGSLAANAGAMGFYLGAKEDTGRWWVSRTRLCHKWKHWFDGDAQCLKLRKQGNKVFWESQKGETGTALIRRSKPSQPRVEVAKAAPVEEKPEPKVNVQPKRETKPVANPVPQTEFASKPVVLKKVVQVAQTTPPKPTFKMASLGASALLTTNLPEPQRAKETIKKAKPKKAKSNAKQATQAKRSVKKSKRKSEIAKAPTASEALRQTSWQLKPSFRVTHVSELDVLNIRERPSEYSPIVGAIPHRARGVKIVGACQAWWCPVSHGQLSGWANRFYLAAER